MNYEPSLSIMYRKPFLSITQPQKKKKNAPTPPNRLYVFGVAESESVVRIGPSDYNFYSDHKNMFHRFYFFLSTILLQKF